MLAKSAIKQDLTDFYDLQVKIAANNATQAEKDSAGSKAQSLGLDNNLKSAQDALWDLSNSLADKATGYLGQFAARGSLHSDGASSWANVAAPSDIAAVEVTKFNLAKCLETTSIFDGDVDGTYSSAGSSTVKEGEERFVIGASYLGTRGVNIAEVSGLLGSFVHGKRVTWTDGDVWVRQKQGEMHKTDLETNFFDYQLNAEEEISVNRHAGKTIKLTTQAGDIIVKNDAENDIKTYVNAAQTVNQTYTKAATQVACTVAATSYAASVLQTSVSTTAASLAVALSGTILSYNAATSRIVVDSTLLTAQLSQNNFFNVARNNLETYIAYLTKVGVKVESADLKAANTMNQLLKTLVNVVSNNTSIIKENFRAENLEINASNSSVKNEKCDTHIKVSKINFVEGLMLKTGMNCFI